MKNKILLFSLLAISTGSMAQSPIKFGVKAGMTVSTMQGDAVKSLNGLLDYTNGMVTTGSRTGFFGGVNANIPMDNVLSIEPGIYFSQKGYELKGALNVKGLEFLGANAKAQLQSQYIDIPVLLKANISGLQLFAGPQVSYLLKSDLRTTAGLLGINLLNSKMDATNQFNRWDAALTGGVGYAFSNGLNVSASYDYGLMKADKGKSMDIYNRGFKVGLGINF